MGGIGRRALESMIYPIDFFDRLQIAGYLDMNNIVALQAAVWHTGREDLYQQTVSFAEQMENVVYTCDPNPVTGKTNTTRSSLAIPDTYFSLEYGKWL